MSLDSNQFIQRERKSDEALLHALSLVLNANSDYAKSVSSLLEGDLQKQQSLDELKNLIADLIKATNNIIQSQNNALKVLEEFSDSYYKDDLKVSLLELFEEQKKETDKKFAMLFKESGLKEDGTEYGPTDKFIVSLKTNIGRYLWYLMSSVLIYHALTILTKKWNF